MEIQKIWKIKKKCLKPYKPHVSSPATLILEISL